MSKPIKFDLYSYHKSPHKVLLSYKGPFEQDVLSIIAEYMKAILRQNPKIGRKILKVFVEVAQNVAYYSVEKNIFDDEHRGTGIGSMTLIETDESYTLYSGNMVSNNNVDKLIEKCELINSLDMSGLREYRQRQLELSDGANDTANFGLIQIAITSANPLGVEVTPCGDEGTFFTLLVSIDKK